MAVQLRPFTVAVAVAAAPGIGSAEGIPDPQVCHNLRSLGRHTARDNDAVAGQVERWRAQGGGDQSRGLALLFRALLLAQRSGGYRARHNVRLKLVTKQHLLSRLTKYATWGTCWRAQQRSHAHR